MNYSKMATQFVCKMAMPLALMFAACSTDEGNAISKTEGNPGVEMGGSSEEPNLVADLEHLMVKGRAGNIYPKMLRTDDDSSLVGGKTTYSPRGTVVTLYELDSVTLDVTGHYFVDTVDNDSGVFAFDGISLHSPYALIEVQDLCITEDCRERGMWYDGLPVMGDSAGVHIDSSRTYSVDMWAIVDLRKIQNVNVNSLTSAKVPLVQKYFAEGLLFAEAGKMAQQDVLESLGVYEVFEDFEKIGGENSELPFVLGILSMAPLSEEWLRILFKGSISYLNIPSDLYSAMGGVMEEYYLNRLKMLDYEAGYLAHRFGLGRCDESRENESKEFHFMNPSYYSIVCHSNKWRPGYRKIEYASGTMTDARDGKTYKTVTYNWNGVTQTWMADNLNYAGVEKTVCFEGDLDCGLYGRFYAWRYAMNLADSSIEVRWNDYSEEYDEESGSYIIKWDTLIVGEECTSKLPINTRMLNGMTKLENAGWIYNGSETYDSAWAYCREKYNGMDQYLNLSKFMPRSKPVRYQGVCPDGWRIPNQEDWQSLFEIVKGLYGEGEASMGLLLKDEKATGFGYMVPVYLVVRDPSVPFLTDRYDIGRISFAAAPDPDSDEYTQVFSYTFEDGREISRGSFSKFYDLNFVVLVRCIKNE